MNLKLISISILICLSGCGLINKKQTMTCTDPNCQPKSNHTLVCTLTSAEMKERKATVIASLQKEMIERKELKNGYAFKFKGTDAMVDELSTFIKTERECCSFFTFDLSVAGDKSTAWLQLTGPEGAKDFITAELGL